jgi:hypothetical protein
MPRCYLIAVAQGSSLDSSSNNWSLFTLVEEIKVPDFPCLLPMEFHTYWQFAPDELNVDFEIRLVFVPTEGAPQYYPTASLKSATPRLRIRARGMRLEAPGDYELRLEWREPQSDQWTRLDVYWPLQVGRLPTDDQVPSEENPPA